MRLEGHEVDLILDNIGDLFTKQEEEEMLRKSAFSVLSSTWYHCSERTESTKKSLKVAQPRHGGWGSCYAFKAFENLRDLLLWIGLTDVARNRNSRK